MKIKSAEFLAVLNGAVKIMEDTKCDFMTALSTIQGLANKAPKLKENQVIIDAAAKLKTCFTKGLNVEAVRLLGIEKYDYVNVSDITYSEFSKVYDEQQVAHYWISIFQKKELKFKIPFNGQMLKVKAARKIKAMDLGLDTRYGFVEGQDEFDGLCQAAQNGENPYRCTIMCANTALNVVG